MDAGVPDCLVTDYEGLEAELHLPDPDDNHVLAAAIMCSAGTIATFNLGDFPESELAPHGITAQHPDEFIEHAIGIDAAAVIAAVRDHRASLAHPSKTVDELLDGYLFGQLESVNTTIEPPQSSHSLSWRRVGGRSFC